MDTLKTFAKYIILLVAFYFFSNFLIFVGLNSTYDNISLKGELPSQVQIDRAEATLVNGRIYGTIQNSDENDLNGKYIKINLYSERDVLLGVKYLDIVNLGENAQEEFKAYFKVQDIASYSIEITDEVEEVSSDLSVFISEDMKPYAIIAALIVLMFI